MLKQLFTTDWSVLMYFFRYMGCPHFDFLFLKCAEEISVLSSNCRCVKWNMHFSSKLGIQGMKTAVGKLVE